MRTSAGVVLAVHVETTIECRGESEGDLQSSGRSTRMCKWHVDVVSANTSMLAMHSRGQSLRSGHESAYRVGTTD